MPFYMGNCAFDPGGMASTKTHPLFLKLLTLVRVR